MRIGECQCNGICLFGLRSKIIKDTMNLEQQPLLEAEGELLPHHYSMEEHGARIKIDRNVYLQHSHTADRSPDQTKCLSINCQPKKFIKSMFPAITWLCTYQWKEWLAKDLIAGATVAIMNVPQGMAYALLGNVPPVVGIYMGLFPVLVYALLGTSRHISMGSFAVVCLMAGNVVTKYATPMEMMNPGNITEPVHFNHPEHYTPIQVASAVAFLVGIYQLVLFVFRFGILCTLLSETLVSGFTAGAAIHVLTSQLKDVFGIKVSNFQGPLKLIYIYGDLLSKLHTTNLAAVVVSAVTVVILIANNEFLKPFAAKRCIVPVPIELIVVLCGTLASSFGGIATTYSLKVVGDIPVGLPEPTLPPFNLFTSIAMDSLVIAIIAYAISLSMALIFATKLKYEIDPNQELFAQGCGNIVGSLFSCLPFAASLSRSAIQQSVGGCTQLTSVCSAAILTGVLLWIAPFFELLPRCVLASLIIVALKGILFQAADIIKIWKVSSLEAIIWVTTYLAVVIVDIDYGLLAGVAASVIILFVKGAQLQILELERLRNTEIFLESDTYSKTERIPGVTIISYTGCINFVNSLTFKKKTMELILGTTESQSPCKVMPHEEQRRETIVLDFRSIAYIDSSGAKRLKFIMDELGNHNKNVLLVGLSGSSLLMLHSCNVLSQSSEPIFPTVQDAVTYSQSKPTNHVYSIRL